MTRRLYVAEFGPEYAVLTGKKSYKEWAFGFLPPGVLIPGNVELAGWIEAPIPSASPTLANTPSPNPSGPTIVDRRHHADVNRSRGRARSEVVVGHGSQ